MQAGHFFQSIYMKMVVTLVLAVIPLYVISLQINRSDAEGVRQRISESIRSQARYYLSSLENELEQVVRFQQQLGVNVDLDTLSNASEIMTNEEKRKAILSVQQQLIQLKSMSGYIANAKAYLPDLGSMIAANQTYADISKAEYEALRACKSPSKVPLLAWNDRLFLCYSNPSLFGVAEPSFVLSAEIDRARMQEALELFKYNGIGGTALVSSAGDWIVAGGGSLELVRRIEERIGEADEQAAAGLSTIRSDEGTYLFDAEYASYLDATFLVFMPEKDVFGQLRENRNRIWYVSIFSLLIIAALSYIVYRLIHHPLRTFIFAFRQVGNGNFNVKIDRSSKDEFAYLYAHFNQTVHKLQELVFEVYEQKYRTQHAELKQLQSQINPHFLYNGFFTIYRMAKFGETANIERFTKHMGDYYRFITRNGSEDVTVREEAEHARIYTEIQLFRFHDRITVAFGEIPDTAADMRIPRLTLQPIIENAFVHALEHKAEAGRLEVAFSHTEERLSVVVEDNGTRLDDGRLDALRRRLHAGSQEAETTGVLNVQRRLRLKFGAEAGLVLSRGPLGGLRVELVIPNK